MKRYFLIPVLALLISISGPMAGSLATPRAGAASPNNKHCGQSLAELLSLYWGWYFKTSSYYGNAPNSVPDHHGDVQFLPIDMDTFGDPYESDGITYFVGYKSVSLKPGESFVLPFLTFNGEKYLDGIPIKSDPTYAWPLTSITTGSIVATLDGVTVLDSSVDNLVDYSSGPNYFKKPIIYGTQPQYRFPVWLDATTSSPTPGYAIATTWAEGVGYFQDPLKKGTHTLHLVAAFNDPRFPFGYDNTWTITVSQHCKK